MPTFRWGARKAERGPTERVTPTERALGWARIHEARRGGIRIHSGREDAYPEVTGYFIPTLVAWGETEFATRCVRWLVRTQRADGGFPSPRGVPYVFDTGQALRGLLAGESLDAGSRPAAGRAADYLVTQMVGGGTRGFGPRYGDGTPEAIHLYVLPALYEAARALDDVRYRNAADKCLEFYLAQEATLNLNDLTHFLAYELEALIDMGRPDVALPILESLRARQAPSGSVPGRGGVSWVCTPGLAQLALCWYKVGDRSTADRSMSWLEAHQGRSGGFLGSYGEGASYFPRVEPSWAVKFYLDAAGCRDKGVARGTETDATPQRPPSKLHPR